MCGFHWCHEETLALLMLIPGLKLFWIWVRAHYHRWFSQPKCGHLEHTCHEHTDLTFTGPPGVTIGPGTIVTETYEGAKPIKLAEVITTGPDGKAIAQALHVKASK
jgi:hypothetical protein